MVAAAPVERGVANRTQTEVRQQQRHADTRLANAEAVLRRRQEDCNRAVRAKEERFSGSTMKLEAAKAIKGLKVSNLDELRSLKDAPNPIVELVARCVATLISSDEVGDENAASHESGPDTPDGARILRARRAAATIEQRETALDRLASPKQPDSARGRLYEPRETPTKPQSPRRLSSPRRYPEGVEAPTPLSARSRDSTSLSARATSPRRPAVRDSDLKRGADGHLLSWEATQKMLQRSDFKLRLINFNGMCLQGKAELVENVRKCLNLSSIKPGQMINILPGRAHSGDRDDGVRERRELVKSLYEASGEDGVYLTPLMYEEARYVNEVIGAMLIWIFRIFRQQLLLIKEWKRLTEACEASHLKVVAAKKVVDERKMVVEDLMKEELGLEERDQLVADVPKPTQLTTPDQISASGSGPMFLFTNARIAGMAPRPICLPERLQLPRSIHFYVHLKSQPIGFPFPSHINTSQYLHEARVVVGQGEGEADLIAQVTFDGKHVIGLADHMLLTFCQLVIEVPSTPSINPTIRATRLSFHPCHVAQLHNYQGNRQRIIVPIYTIGGDSAPTDERAVSPLPHGNKHKTSAVPPFNVPALPIPLPSPIAIGNPLNARSGTPGRESSRNDEPSDSALSPPRSARQGAWSKSRLVASEQNERSVSARSCSPPPSKKAAERVLAYRAEALMRPLIAKVGSGYLLTSAEMRRLQRLAYCVENPPTPSTPTYGLLRGLLP